MMARTPFGTVRVERQAAANLADRPGQLLESAHRLVQTAEAALDIEQDTDAGIGHYWPWKSTALP